MLDQDICNFFRPKGAVAGQQLIEHHADAIYIALNSGLPLDLFRGHICRRSSEGQRRFVEFLAIVQQGWKIHRLLLSGGENLDQAKVGEEQGTVRLKEQVRRLDIAMDQPTTMSILQRLQDLLGQVQDFSDSKTAVRLQAVSQRPLRHQGHNQVCELFLLTIVVDQQNVGVVQVRQNPGFPGEMAQEVARFSCLWTKDFDRYVAMQMHIFSLIDGCCPPGPQWPKDVVVANTVANKVSDWLHHCPFLQRPGVCRGIKNVRAVCGLSFFAIL